MHEFCLYVQCACTLAGMNRSKVWSTFFFNTRSGSRVLSSFLCLLSLFIHAVQNDKLCSIMHGFCLLFRMPDVTWRSVFFTLERKRRPDLIYSQSVSRCSEWFIIFSFACILLRVQHGCNSACSMRSGGLSFFFYRGRGQTWFLALS